VNLKTDFDEYKTDSDKQKKDIQTERDDARKKLRGAQALSWTLTAIAVVIGGYATGLHFQWWK
jgi:hypothetical protein